MKVNHYDFGIIVIDGKEYYNDIIIQGGIIRKRKKKASKPFRAQFGHTPLSVHEDIPWDCGTLVIGCGMNSLLPVMDEVKQEAGKRGVKLVMLPTTEALSYVNDDDTNVILHLSC